MKKNLDDFILLVLDFLGKAKTDEVFIELDGKEKNKKTCLIKTKTASLKMSYKKKAEKK